MTAPAAGPWKLTTALALDAVAWERAPRYPGRHVNRRIICADGFKVSVQASVDHYANDSDPSGDPPYFSFPGTDRDIAYPFITFEVGAPSSDPAPTHIWDGFDAGGVWAWVPRTVIAALLNLHGGADAWEES